PSVAAFPRHPELPAAQHGHARAHLRALRTTARVHDDRRRPADGGHGDRCALSLLLPPAGRRGTRSVADPRRRARAGRVPDGTDRPSGRSDRLEPPHARGHPAQAAPHRARQPGLMRAAFFGTYNRRHTANRIASCAVRAAGYEIVEFHDALWERTRDKDAAYFSPRSLIVLARQWLASAWRLSRAWWRSGGAPVAIVGFNGQLDILLLKMLAPRYGPRIVFAPLVSLTETLVEDRRVYAEGTFG